MRKSFVTKEYEIFRVNGVLRRILRATVAKENTRYCLKYVRVEKNKIIATDGRKLVVVTVNHEIKTGLYYVTQGGFLLVESGKTKFPKWQDILLKGKEVVADTITGMRITEQFFSAIVCKLNRRDVAFDIFLFQEALLDALKVCGDGSCKIETISPDHAFQLTFTIDGYRSAEVVYLQMPVTIKE